MNRKRWIAFILGVSVAAGGVGYLTYHLAGRSRRNRVYEDLQETAVAQPVVTQIATYTEPEPEEEKEPYVSPIDFEALWKMNPDIYAWISIDETDVSYPVVQSATDDSYYLNHTVEGAKGYPGSIYTMRVNAKDFSDFNTVIYGHNMKDDTMFGSLAKYRDETYLEEHRTIRVYLPDRELVYTVFGAVVYNDRLITSWYDNADPEACEAFLKSVEEARDLNSHVLEDIEVTSDDRILTLSTCIGGRPNNRYLVLAVMTDENA